MQRLTERLNAGVSLDLAADASAREALIAGLTTGPAAEVAEDGECAVEAASARDAARALENRRRRLRANAHAAYHTVRHGTEEAALDVALAVVEADWLALRAERDAYAEALKMIRLYARDTEVRGLAAQVLPG